MKKYLVVVNEYEEFGYVDAVLQAWERNPIYDNGKRIFHLVNAENGKAARHQLIHQLIPVWLDEYTPNTLWHINDCFLDHYKHMDQQFLGDLFTTITTISKEHGRIEDSETFNKLFSDEMKLALYQDLMLTTYHVYEYSEL